MTASCLGLQIKLLKDFPNTCQQLMDSVLSLDIELDSIKCLHAYELIRYMPNDLLLADDAKMINGMAPLIFFNKFKGKKMAKKLWEHLIAIDGEIFKRNSGVIFVTITQ
jgi:hypothetical protein